VSIVDYPTTATTTTDVFSAHDTNKAMSCLAFTNTHGKSNPGDRVDMDVSGLRSGRGVCGGGAYNKGFREGLESLVYLCEHPTPSGVYEVHIMLQEFLCIAVCALLGKPFPSGALDKPLVYTCRKYLY
jgi:hypothetical protein